MTRLRYKHGPDTVCVCGVMFTPRIDNPSKTGMRFCSKKCAAVHRVKSVKNMKRCIHCNKSFHAYKKKMVFCSRQCAHVARPPRFNPDRDLISARKKMRAFCCKMVERCLNDKTDKVYNLLGYSADDLRRHLESKFQHGMSWDNYSHSGWHVDHKKPISSFHPDTPVSIINALSNLQPLWSTDNFKKGSKLI